MRVYIIRNQFGYCVWCGEYKDLRYGYCFSCADHTKDESDLCYRGGLGNFDTNEEQCVLRCKFSVKCRRKGVEI